MHTSTFYALVLAPLAAQAATHHGQRPSRHNPKHGSIVRPSTTTVQTTNTSADDGGEYANAQPTDVGVGATEQCGTDDRVAMDGMPWTVANSMYGADFMSGSQCTNFDQVLQAEDGTYLVDWTSVTQIDQIDDTADITKGYSNIGVGPNLRTPLSSVQSIPAYWSWSRTTNGDEDSFKGSNIYDFITSPVEGAGQEPESNEFMLFLSMHGGQLPIGWEDGSIGTFNLYGMNFDLYSGPNQDHGQMVWSLIPESNFEDEFQGDLKEWLVAMADAGYGGQDDYVNVGNCGVEVFYGDSTQTSRVALDVIV